MSRTCDAKTRSGGSCQRPAGWGTDHKGKGRCKLHGGASTGAPKGNKNALKTGEHETIWFDTLTEDEQALLPQVPSDALTLVRDEVRLASIRERRMLQRIQTLTLAGDFTVVERKVEHKEGVDAGDEAEDNTGSVFYDKTQITEAGTLGQIQEIEQGLTRVQAMKGRLIELLSKLAAGEQIDDPLVQLMETIAASRKLHEAG